MAGGTSQGKNQQKDAGDEVFIELTKLARNTKRVHAKIVTTASLEAIWNILTDYDNLYEHGPSLVVTKLIEKKDNRVQFYQISKPDLPFGLKYTVKAVFDCHEKDLEIFASGKRREIEYNMIEGDYDLYKGKWSIEQIDKPRCDGSDISGSQEFETTFSYVLDIKLMLWVPVQLVEGRLCKEIKTHLLSITEKAQKMMQNGTENAPSVTDSTKSSN